MTNSTSRAPLWDDLRAGWFFAAWFSVAAVSILVVVAALGFLGIIKVSDLDQVPLGLPLILLGYFIAGTLGGFAFWLLRLLGSSLVGWVLRGFVITALVYSAIGVTGILGFYIGIDLLGLKSAEEGWRMLPIFSGVVGVFPGTLLGVVFWHERRHG